MKRWISVAKFAAGLCAIFAITAGCGASGGGGAQGSANAGEVIKLAPNYKVKVDPSLSGEVRIAHGFGLIYAPMEIVQQLGVLEHEYPNLDVKWSQIFTTDQQRDAMLAGSLDFGSATPGPLLQSRDSGVDLKALQVVTGWDAQLMVPKNGPNALTDFIGTNMKISPGPATAQYFAVQAALSQAGQSIHALDHNFVNIPHPTAIQALKNGSLTGEFATANYIIDARNAGAKSILSFKKIYGGRWYTTSAMGLAKTIQAKPKIAKAYANALAFAAEWMKQNPTAAAKVLSKIDKISVKQELTYLKSDVFRPQTTDGAFDFYAKSMKSIGALKKVPTSPGEVYAYPSQAGSDW